MRCMRFNGDNLFEWIIIAYHCTAHCTVSDTEVLKLASIICQLCILQALHLAHSNLPHTVEFNIIVELLGVATYLYYLINFDRYHFLLSAAFVIQNQILWRLHFVPDSH